DLTRADLTRAHASGSKFDGAKFARATLRRADLRGASLIGADLRNADLREAVLAGADLTGADVAGADFTRAVPAGGRVGGGKGKAKGFPPPVVRTPGPSLVELAKVAGASKNFLTTAEVDLGQGEHAKLELTPTGAWSRYRREGSVNEVCDRIDAPTFE